MFRLQQARSANRRPSTAELDGAAAAVAYYPDFLVWLKDAESQHLIFLDPKGLSHFGHAEIKKMQMHREIAEIAQQVRKVHADLHLHAYILSVTAPDKIGAERRSKDKWEEEGVYFLQDADCLQRVIARVLQSEQKPS